MSANPRRPLLALLLAGLMFAPPAAAARPAPPKSAGSAARLVIYRRPQRHLPPPVQRTRLAVIQACIKADYAGLEKLALAGPRRFAFTFGPVKRPSVFWRNQEAAGNPILAKIVKTLHMKYAKNGQGGLYVWPSAYGDNPQDSDWELLRWLYSEREIVLFRNYGGFLGMRVGIASDGQWLYAIEGD